MKTETAIAVMEQVRAFFDEPEVNGALDFAIDALWEKLEAKKNEPLTMQELLTMNGQPVFVASTARSKNRKFGEWCVMFNGSALIAGSGYSGWRKETYGKTWVAYRHKPDEAVHG